MVAYWLGCLLVNWILAGTGTHGKERLLYLLCFIEQVNKKEAFGKK